MQTPRNWSRWSNPELDKIIEQIRAIAFDDPKGIELGKEFVKLAVQEMPIIPLMSYNVFTMMDETYWTGYPTAADPYTNPVPNWSNSRYMMVRLKPDAAVATVAKSGEAAARRLAGCLAHAKLRHLRRQAAGAVRAGRLHRHIADLLHHASDADRSGRADDRLDDRLRRHQPRGRR